MSELRSQRPHALAESVRARVGHHRDAGEGPNRLIDVVRHERRCFAALGGGHSRCHSGLLPIVFLRLKERVRQNVAQGALHERARPACKEGERERRAEEWCSEQGRQLARLLRAEGAAVVWDVASPGSEHVVLRGCGVDKGRRRGGHAQGV